MELAQYWEAESLPVHHPSSAHDFNEVAESVVDVAVVADVIVVVVGSTTSAYTSVAVAKESLGLTEAVGAIYE